MTKDAPVKIFSDNLEKARKLQAFYRKNENMKISLQSLVNMSLATNLNEVLKRCKIK